jgi:hypothetical protein
MEVSISSNCSVYVRVTDQNGNTYEQNRYIECFDKTKPTIIAAAKNGILIVQGVDAESGIAALYVNGNEFTELTNNTLNVRLQKADTSYEYFTLQRQVQKGDRKLQLVIAEKPSVARNIAKVLHATNVKDGYLEGKEYLVSWCIGHLIELASADQYRYDWNRDNSC